ncbi:MAG: hypothetical protein U5K33_09900 [Halofilum sp. (in: g-proteobacteria)]|nr:hypothetical protein [Halofilum sp. (in: g-proteobacteria)]
MQKRKAIGIARAANVAGLPSVISFTVETDGRLPTGRAIAEVDGRVASSLAGYPLADESEPTDYSELPPMFVPMQRLGDMAPRTRYVNVLATSPKHRRPGVP